MLMFLSGGFFFQSSKGFAFLLSYIEPSSLPVQTFSFESEIKALELDFGAGLAAFFASELWGSCSHDFCCV